MRPVDWSPLGWGQDPVPGEPERIASAVVSYRNVASHISRAAINLTAAANTPAGCSEAVTALGEQARVVSASIARTESRYTGAAAALSAYATALRQAQADSAHALVAATNAQADQRAQRNQVDGHATTAQHATDPVQKAASERSRQQAMVRFDEAGSDLATARAKLTAAIAQRDQAATQAIGALDDVEASSPIGTDSFVDDARAARAAVVELLGAATSAMAQVLAVVARTVWENLDTILLVLGVALTIAAVFASGGTLLPFLVTAIKVVTVVSKIKSSIDGLRSLADLAANGASVGDVATALVSVGVGLLLGKAAKKIVRKHSSVPENATTDIDDAATWTPSDIKVRVEDHAIDFVTRAESWGYDQLTELGDEAYNVFRPQLEPARDALSGLWNAPVVPTLDTVVDRNPISLVREAVRARQPEVTR